MTKRLPLVVCLFTICANMGFGQTEAVIVDKQGCLYQIVIPEEMPHPVLQRVLKDGAELLREMFAANGWEVAVVVETQADAEKPGIFLGSTARTLAAGLDTDTMPVNSYLWKLIGQDLFITGRDWAAAPIKISNETPCSHGTVKGLLDFMREYCGTRFLMPGGRGGIEHLALERIVVPAGLDLTKTPHISFSSGQRTTTDLYRIALNFFDNTTLEFTGHTHELAVPASKYADTNPEYFALIGGQRIREYKHGWLGMQKEPHLCYSNPDVQELIYKDMLRSFDAGYKAWKSLQADGFRPCQCEECKALFDTSDWGEKLWQLNKMWAERLLKDRPDNLLIVSSYTVTGKPPQSFSDFPPNMLVSVGGYPQAFAVWSKQNVPGGFMGGSHAWGSYHLCGYMPVRTPLYSEKTVRMFAEHKVLGLTLDSPPALLWALEGPAVYTFGRMFDDPENNNVKDIVAEYIKGSYGKAESAMRRFYDKLHHTLEVYAEVFGVDNGIFQYYRNPDGRNVRYLTWRDKLRLISFLYPPETLDTLDQHLLQAERTIGLGERQQLRLKLARREFEYLRSTARVVHLYQSYQTLKDRTSMTQLLDEMEARRDLIMSWYEPRREYKPGVYLQQPLDPDLKLYIGGPGYYNDHLLRNGGSYLSKPVPPFTWDIDAMRQAPLFETPAINVARIQAAPSIDSKEWDSIATVTFGPLTLGDQTPQLPGKLKLAYDSDAIYLLFEGELPVNWVKPPAMQRDNNEIPSRESFGFVFSTDGNTSRFLRFAGGTEPSAFYDARRGFLEDSIDPRFNSDDTSWDPEITYNCNIAADASSWRSFWRIPFAALETGSPGPGAEWRGNFGRVHEVRRWYGKGEKSLWSANPNTDNIDDTSAFGIIRFE